MEAGVWIRGGRVLDPVSGRDDVADVAVAGSSVLAIAQVAPQESNPQAMAPGFAPHRVIDASGCWVLPGLVDLAVRLREPGCEHARMLESEMSAAMAGGITSLVCQPDTDPVLDEPGLVEMLRFRAEKLRQARVYPMGALTCGLRGEMITEMVELSEAGCVAFGQADVALMDTQVLLRAMQYASTFGYAVWLRPQDPWLGKGVAASGPRAMRMGLSGVPVVAETIALHTIFALMQATGARVHLCRISSAEGVELVRAAKARGLPVSCDVAVHSLHLCDEDLGDFDSRARMEPVLRQRRDRDALRAALADGTIDALVSNHTPVGEDAKTLPFAEAEPGATALELLLSLAYQWHLEDGVSPLRCVQAVTSTPSEVLGSALGTRQGRTGRLQVGGLADVCVFDPRHEWVLGTEALCSQGKHTPFVGRMLHGRVRATIVGARVAYEAD
ncbi:dihydroorotase [Candidatus Symbiobacter mobilis]|uniref:Dihydroorotase-like protein n=1 Tax=Candidatus Symbiobacter mobilis CR TaxID=946483 RepID=U5NBP7_9BURK|nr:dihydroorotase [Candidatus Symbiobacter mobilis]AGX87604.1 dihydroorotase-like protein [Candidatus Symbiobacter mobilis CR]